MPLLPVIRVKVRNQQYVGLPGDSHCDIERRWKTHTWDDAQRGFTPDNGETFLSRREAADYIHAHDRALWQYISSQIDTAIGLHSHHLSPHTDLSRLKALVIDKGLYLYLAERLAQDFGTVYYHFLSSSPYPKSPLSQIGTGLQTVVKVDDPYTYFDKVDVIIYFDIYEGRQQQWLREKGYRVFGSGLSERVEVDREYFLDQLESLGLNAVPTMLFRGLEAAADYLKPRRNKWLKTPYYRGDFETKHYTSWRQIEPWFYALRAKIGEVRAREIPILVQDHIESAAEIGYDGFRLDGRTTLNCVAGYEVKDKGLVAKIFPHPPDVLEEINRGMDPLFAKLGYRNHHSTEIRIKSDGSLWFIDPCCRPPSPPGELLSKYANYSQVIYQLACGLLPIPIPPKLPNGKPARYGAEIVLCSGVHGCDIDDELGQDVCVQFPSDVADNVILKNYFKRDGAWYCTPNHNAGAFGNVVAWAETMDDAIEVVKEIAGEVECDGLEWNENVFDKAEEAVAAGEKFGINWDEKEEYAYSWLEETA